QSAWILVPVRNCLWLASEGIPSSVDAAEDRRDYPGAHPERRHPLGPWDQALARSGRADGIKEMARVHRGTQHRVRSRLAHAHLLHDIQSPAPQREQMG